MKTQTVVLLNDDGSITFMQVDSETKQTVLTVTMSPTAAHNAGTELLAAVKRARTILACHKCNECVSGHQDVCSRPSPEPTLKGD